MTSDTNAGFSPASNWAPDRLLTPRETASYLAISPGTLANERSTGTSRMPYIRVGSRIRYRVADVQAYVSGQQVSA